MTQWFFFFLFIYGVILSLSCRFGDDIVDSNEVTFVSTQECKPFRLGGWGIWVFIIMNKRSYWNFDDNVFVSVFLRIDFELWQQWRSYLIQFIFCMLLVFKALGFSYVIWMDANRKLIRWISWSSVELFINFRLQFNF